MQKILALSSSRVGGGDYLESAAPIMHQFLGTQSLKIAFVPFASVDKDYEPYLSTVQQALAHLPYQVLLVTEATAIEVIKEADVIMIGGGNTFKLLHDLYQLDLINSIKEKVARGTPYIGWSAGANLVGLSIRTTNDMPIIQPPGFEAFQFFPFQINPHYLNETRQGFHGETRDQRLEEFIKLNIGIPVVGLPEGTALQLHENKLSFTGATAGVLFESDGNGVPKKRTMATGEDLTYLMQRANALS